MTSFHKKKKKILHTSFKLCNDMYSNLIFLASTLLYSLGECPVVPRECSYFNSFSPHLSSFTGTGYWMKENLQYMRARDCAGSKHSLRGMYAWCLHVGLYSCKSPADPFPDFLAWLVWGLQTHRSVCLWSESPYDSHDRLSHRNVRTNE